MQLSKDFILNPTSVQSLIGRSVTVGGTVVGRKIGFGGTPSYVILRGHEGSTVRCDSINLVHNYQGKSGTLMIITGTLREFSTTIDAKQVLMTGCANRWPGSYQIPQ